MRMMQPGDRAACLDVRMFEEAGVAVQLLMHDAFGGQAFRPVRERLRGEQRAQCCIDLARLVVAALGGAEPLVGGEVVQAHRLAEAEPFMQAHHGDRHPAVGDLIDAAGRARRPDRAAFEIRLHHAHHLQSGRRLQQAGLDMPAARLVAPGVERCGYG